MPDAGFMIGWGVIGVLLVFLWFKHHQRVRRRAEALEEVGWHATGFDSTPLKPRIEAVRHNPLGEQRSTAGFYFHLELLASMRETVAHSAYFEEIEAEKELSQARGNSS